MPAQGYDFFSGSQLDISRRLLRKIEALEAANVDLESRVKALEDAD